MPRAVGDRWMLRVLRASGGSAIAVSDERLLAGTQRLARSEGFFAAPEAGAVVAALEDLVARGELEGAREVVLFSTGTGLKYSECFS